MSDGFRAADVWQGRFSFETAAAFLANTRTHIFGTDNLGGLAEAANSEPGGFPFMALDYANAQDAGAAGVVYDCATKKCSDGTAPRGIVFPWSCLFKDAGHLAHLCSDSKVLKSDGTDGPSVFGDYGSWGSQLLGITKEDRAKYVKQFAFILLAIVLIYAALRSIN